MVGAAALADESQQILLVRDGDAAAAKIQPRPGQAAADERREVLVLRFNP